MSRAKEFDLVLYGATGFTGRLVARYLAEHVGTTVRWAIAGRNSRKLMELRETLGSGAQDIGVLVADSSDGDAISSMVSKARVILTTAGPFDIHGELIVKSCVESGAHYVDITGEPPYVKRLIDRYHDAAKAKRLRIVPFCGFDSIPSDLGTMLAVRELRRKTGSECAEAKAFFQVAGGFNGGTIATALRMQELYPEQIQDVLLLNPDNRKSQEERDRSADRKTATFDRDLQKWATPFFMAPINTRVVRRSNALLADAGQSYGSEFRYAEALATRSRLAAGGVALLMQSINVASRYSWVRKAIEKVAPDPGQGPSEEVMKSGFFKTTVFARNRDNDVVRVEVKGKGDPGNGVTVPMVCESALALIHDVERLPHDVAEGGVLTPVTGIGSVLLERLRPREILFEVVSPQ